MGDESGLWMSVKQCGGEVASTLSDRYAKARASTTNGIENLVRLRNVSTSQVPGAWEAAKDGAQEKVDTFLASPVDESVAFGKSVAVDQWETIDSAANRANGGQQCGAVTGVVIDTVASKIDKVAGVAAAPLMGAVVSGEKAIERAGAAAHVQKAAEAGRERALDAPTRTGAVAAPPKCTTCAAEGAGPKPLERMHSDATTTGTASYQHWRRQRTDDIVRSLRRGEDEPLRVGTDGKVWDGNTRVKVLQERGYNVDRLPRETYRRSTYDDMAP